MSNKTELWPLLKYRAFVTLIIDRAGVPLEGFTRGENITLTTSIINHKWMLDCIQNTGSVRSTQCLIVVLKKIIRGSLGVLGKRS